MQKVQILAALLRAVLLAVFALGAAPHSASAQPAESSKQGFSPADEAHALAQALLQRMGGSGMLDSVILSNRPIMVERLIQQRGKTQAQAEKIVDQFMMPEFRARAPELMARFEDVLVKNLSLAEMRAVLDGRDNDALRAAQAKGEQLPMRFLVVGQAWGIKVGSDVLNQSRAALDKLGLNRVEIIR